MAANRIHLSTFNSSGVRKFVIKASVFFCFLLVIAYSLDFIVTSGLRKAEYGNYGVWNDIFDGRIEADLIINGSSRAMVQASPAILDSVLGIKSYNLGFNGYGLPMQLCRFNLFVKYNFKPGVVVHEVDYGTFSHRDDLYEWEQFLPYLKDSAISIGTRMYKGFRFWDYHLPLVRYYSNFPAISSGILEYFGIAHFKSEKYKGYQGNSFAWDGKFELAKTKFPNGLRTRPEAELFESFKSYLQECKEDSISVVLVWMPEYVEGQKFVLNRDSVVDTLQGIATRFQVPMLDYSSDSICYDRTLFYNSRHLNRTGAQMFTRKLASDLSRLQILN